MKLSADIRFNEDGVPVSNQFDDIYFSVDSGIDESRYVFLEQNGLPERFKNLPQHYEFVVTETGFGTGLNFLICWQLFLQQAPVDCRLLFVSFEKFPLTRDQLQQAYQTLPSLAPLCEQLLAVYPATDTGCHRLLLANGRITLDLWVGDLEQQLNYFLPQATGQIDCWFLDGFAPAKNPDMWQPGLFRSMAESAHANTSYATFTAAGVVKRGLSEAGFKVEKIKGFGRKREMLRGQLAEPKLAQKKPSLNTTPVTIVGGGIAAATLALALTHRSVPVQVISSGIADAASGNPQGAVYPLLHAEITPLSQFYLQAFSTAVSCYLPWQQQHWFPTGVMQPAFNQQRQLRAEKIANNLYHPDSVSFTTKEHSNAAAQIPLNQDSLHYPRAGWLRPERMVNELFAAAGCQPQQASFSAEMDSPATPLVIAAGHNSAYLVEQLSGQSLPINPVRGQISLVKASPLTRSLNKVLCYKGYMIPADNGVHCIGATFNRADASDEQRANDDLENQTSLKSCANQLWADDLSVVGSRASVRATTPDHQPVIGRVIDNLYLLSGLGSRGLTAAPLLAEILAAQLTGGLQPLSDDALRRLSVDRFGDRR
ncbi:bifunctional tRNA (5-methylaminomethyl-2-thiouridine)(34)-methyltransferase MnmD/FAD-dependent 5-carboxymethylaminomethyl-2-thiouridine(34) oxidoreductase MnmC [Idiomarina seosinensis]|uniref:tRNA 5-methylaminomethyl-2-thiouridine biosynthesis bifunctional protein MnmC n=1 Tax=Idiomarina seosinensis TaxID=281739 RepID=A0A432ZGU1_9GAMM|nr:bifunctional tRNA (5-methylaminomethyl-2-thiouridine)(34)-methyltransferase MnmD/FAD-dependent 5-carboxymethylaminomethyl-2-thiouridine(34) oxidoreductase MnmC [Idiomarina seosinensis]RUO77149.1 bifunctional tRNA (5-methylaminomethyl-2-thiouridine)(34)-methyltransferase MnmD/FAD-dependent 5-carboxymethylaminomethyl-2-thiouridine(34) oxidoreductase MnmC [Idiomarina seosinensis]